MRNWMKALASADVAFSPSQLFASSELGGWYDPSDLSTMWKDTGGTSAVTADGDRVARIDDKSGNGNHLLQATLGSRPTYKTSGGLHWLDFSGANYIESASFSSYIMEGEGAVAAAVGSDAPEANQNIIEEVDISANDERVQLSIDTRSNRRMVVWRPDDAVGSEVLVFDSEQSGTERVLIFSHNGTTGTGYVDNSAQSSTVTTTETFSTAVNHIIGMGRQVLTDIAYLDGKVYGALIIDRALTTTERSNLNDWLSTKAGI